MVQKVPVVKRGLATLQLRVAMRCELHQSTIFEEARKTMEGSLGCHLEKILELQSNRTYPLSAICKCLKDLRNQLRDFENERRLLIKLSETGRVVLAVQRCLVIALEILNLQEAGESISWRNTFQRERDEWMERIKLLLRSRWRMKMETRDERQSLEILTRLRYGIERYRDALTSEELDVMSDVFDAVVHKSNVVVVGLPRWFATSKHDWSYVKTTPVRGTDDQIYHDVDLFADLNHPHVRKFFGACHVGKKAFVIHEVNYPANGWGPYWNTLLGYARGLEYVHGCGLAHRSLTVSDLLLAVDNRGILSGLGLVRRSDDISFTKADHLFRRKSKQQASPGQDIFAFGLCIFTLLTQRSSWLWRIARYTKRLFQPSKRLPAKRPRFIEEDEWELLSLMCSSTEMDRIGIRDVIYRMELLADHEENGISDNDDTDPVNTMEVVAELSLFKVNTLGLTLEETLSEIELSCDELTVFSAVNQPVLSRLKDVYSQLQGATGPLPLEVVERFSLILVRFLDSLDRRGFGGGSLVASVCASRTIANKNYSIHHDLDSLIQCTPQLQNDSSIHSWLPHFQETQDLHRATLQGYWENPLPTLNELDSEADQNEAAALLEFEARKHGDELALFDATRGSLPKWFIPSYQVELGRHIADGSFGSVYEGKWLGADVVVKMVMTDQRNAENRRQFLREVDLWFSLSDRRLIKLYGACHVGQPFFVCERALEGTLGGSLKKREPIKERLWSIYQSALGLQHLHHHGIIHGDLKGNNILKGDTVKLCDFGLASLASSGPIQLSETEVGSLGAIRWKAPECLLGGGPTFASDIYSFAMCIIEILTGQYPWGTTMPDSVVKMKVTQDKLLPPRPEDVGDNWWYLITRMCCFDPQRRVNIGTVVNVVSEMFRTRVSYY